MSIFEDDDKVIENTRESAKALGFNVPNMVKKKVKVAKNNCKTCYGVGVLKVGFPGNKGNDSSQLIYCQCVSEKEIEVVEEKESVQNS